MFDDGLLGKIRELFQRRNALVHAAPSYVEPAEQFRLVEDEDEPESGLRLEKTADTIPQLISSGVSSTDVDQAVEFYETAVTFLDLLRLAPPALPDPNRGRAAKRKMATKPR
jgi:hypothetical protein